MANLTDAILTDHAREQISVRQVTEAQVRQVLATPDAVQPVRQGRVLAQKRLAMDNPAKVYLVRVVVDIDREPAEIVTAYRTSRIQRYEGQS